MPDLVRVTRAYPDAPTSINPTVHSFLTWGPVYPSADINSAVPVRIAYNVGRKRYETIAAGGAGLVNGTSTAGIVHGFTGAWVKFATGPNATPVAVLIEAEFGNYSTDVTTTMYKAYVSAAVVGALTDTPVFAGQLPVAFRFGFTPNAAHLGDKLYVNSNGVSFGQ